MHLSKAQRTSILAKIEAAVSKKFYDPAFDEAAWQSIVARHREKIVNAESPENFEMNVGAMLKEFSPKSLGLLSDRTPINPRNAINASFSVHQSVDGARWVFQDVLLQAVEVAFRQPPCLCGLPSASELMVHESQSALDTRDTAGSPRRAIT